MKKPFTAIIFLFLLINYLTPSYAYQALVLSDDELDNVSAAGFDINVEAVQAIRAAVVSQNNIAAVVSENGNIDNTTINNINNTSVQAFDSGVQISQNNIAALIALNGDITNAAINNINQATASGELNSAIVSQSNIAILLANNISNSTINNINVGGVGVSSPINTPTEQVQFFNYKDWSIVVGVSTP